MKRLLLVPTLWLGIGLFAHPSAGTDPAITAIPTLRPDPGLIYPKPLVEKELPAAGLVPRPDRELVRYDRPVAKKEGAHTEYYDNGIMQFRANFRKSRLSGGWKSWYPSGQPCDSGRFKGSSPDGEWRGWYPNGRLRFIWHFNAAKLNAVKDEILRRPRYPFYSIARLPLPEALTHIETAYMFGQSPPHRST